MQTDAPPRSTRLTVLLPFAIVTLIWGTTWIVITGQLGVVPATWSVCYRFLVAGVAVAGWALWQRESFVFDLRGWGFAVAIGLSQFCLNFNFVYRAEMFITSGVVAVIFALLFLPNAVLSRIFLGLRMGRELAIGSLIACAGVALLFLHEAGTGAVSGAALAAGIGFTLAGVLSASTANVLQATQTARAYPMYAMLAVSMLLGAGFNAAWAWSTVGPPVFDPRPSYWLGVLHLGILASAVAFPLYFGVLRTIGPTKAAYSGVIVPVIAMLISTIFEGYQWSLLAGAGAVLAMIGLVTALRARRPNR